MGATQMDDVSRDLVQAASLASNSARNEAQLRHEIEVALQRACISLRIAWTPFQMERALKQRGASTKFIDVAHGGVLIEYEPPRCFSGGANAKARHARRQIEEYSHLISLEEGRPLVDYLLIAWDGASITFGRHSAENQNVIWESVIPFDINSASRLLMAMASSGRPFVHPKLLQSLIGPDSESGIKLIPVLYAQICSSSRDRSNKTKILFSEWVRLFGQVVGFQPDGMKRLLRRQEISHGQPYEDNPSAYLFALNTYVAIVAKVVVACALPNAAQSVLDSSVPLKARLTAVENGSLYEGFGILNMLDGDFFSWYLEDAGWSAIENSLEGMVSKLSGVDFTVAKKDPATTRDLFKGIYEEFIPREIRHALGEFYTPDWLAEFVISMTEWKPEDSITDPACGSGTFLLEALRRRLVEGWSGGAREMLAGISGVDLNPLAVLTAKASLAVFMSQYLNPKDPVRLPVYLADSINPAKPAGGLFPSFYYSLRTELGIVELSVPVALIKSDAFYPVFRRIRDLIEEDRGSDWIKAEVNVLLSKYGLGSDICASLVATIDSFVDLHNRGWNGIWCSIVADRFAAGAIEPAQYVCGNPPWIKWSNLPREYTGQIQQLCKELGVFSNDRWVGGIEGDVSTVVAFQAIETYLSDNGQMCLLMPGSVFETPSSAGFRRMRVGKQGIPCAIEMIEDFDEIAPFDGVANMPRAILVRKGVATSFPVQYRKWSFDSEVRSVGRYLRSAGEFYDNAIEKDLRAWPVPGGSDRPWIVGLESEIETLNAAFGGGSPNYVARKGVTADRNGIFWVKECSEDRDGLTTIQNDAGIGKTKGIPTVRAPVETQHIFPLLRGRGVSKFRARPDAELRYFVPQRQMHGDAELHLNSPFAYSFLRNFKSELERRSSLKRFQKGKPYYSLWSIGEYTFSPFKVLWKEIGGGKFEVAYVGSADIAGRPVVVIPDHKLYFIPVETEYEAAFLTGFLGSTPISKAIASYGASLSFGASVASYVNIPTYDPSSAEMRELAEAVIRVSAGVGKVEESEQCEIDYLVARIVENLRRT